MNSKNLNNFFEKYKVDAIISEAPQTRLWYSKISTTDGWLIIEPNSATLFVDGRYFEYASKNAKNVKLELLKGNSLNSWFDKKKFKKIAIEADYLTVENKEKIKRMTNIDQENILYVNSKKLRISKSEEEINNVQKAINISLESFEKLKPFIKSGISEKELQDKLEYIMCRLGADKEAFDTIVAFAENTAEPHHHSKEKILKSGDIITIDFGAKYNGYCADITRTFIFEEEKRPNDKYREVLNIVEEAAKLGRNAVRPGIRASEIDNICRSYIASKGYSNFFLHSTGHGLGIDVHELPIISPHSNDILEEGMIITVEPGIYIEGICGARIEDDILVTKDGHRVLSKNK